MTNLLIIFLSILILIIVGILVAMQLLKTHKLIDNTVKLDHIDELNEWFKTRTFGQYKPFIADINWLFENRQNTIAKSQIIHRDLKLLNDMTKLPGCHEHVARASARISDKIKSIKEAYRTHNHEKLDMLEHVIEDL